MTHHCIYFGKCSKQLREHICRLVGIRPVLNVNGMTYAGTLSDVQKLALQPYIERKEIQIRTFK